MTFGEQLYLAMVLIGFAALAITLATVAYQTSRYQRTKEMKGATRNGPDQPSATKST